MASVTVRRIRFHCVRPPTVGLSVPCCESSGPHHIDRRRIWIISTGCVELSFLAVAGKDHFPPLDRPSTGPLDQRPRATVSVPSPPGMGDRPQIQSLDKSPCARVLTIKIA